MPEDPGSNGSEPGTDLAAFLPPMVARQVLAVGSPTLPARRFHASVLFADIAGFSTMAEAFSRSGAAGAEELTGLLDAFFDWAVDAVDRRGGHVGAFGGDAITAVFPDDELDDSAAQAVAAASEIVGGMDRFVDMRTSLGSFTIACKIGVADGPMLVAATGTERGRAAWWFAGGAMDEAALAEHAARPGEVLVSPAVAAKASVEGSERDAHLIVDRAPTPDLPAPEPLGQIDGQGAMVLARFTHPSVEGRLRAGQHRFLQEHRRICVAFVGFETSDLDTDVGAASISPIVERVVEACASLDGHVHQIDAGDKGSKAVVTFGAAVMHEDDHERILRFAARVRSELPGITRIGIATGTVFCGEIGGARRREYTAIGDTMNVAARLMQMAERDQILCGDDMVAHARRIGRVGSPRSLQLKGRQGEVSIADLETIDAVGLFVGERHYRLAIVGRDAELEALARDLEQTRLGEGTPVVVEGDPGLGKSRLVAEMAQRAADGRFEALMGACSPMDRSTPFRPWRRILREAMGLPHPAASDPDAAQVRLRAVFEDRAPLVAQMLGLRMDSSAFVEGLDDRLRAEIRTMVVTEFLLKLARRNPLVITVEDAHHIDPASAELFTATARAAERDAIAIVATTRPVHDVADGTAPTDWLPRARVLRLGPLPDDAMRSLLDLVAADVLALPALRTGPLAGFIIPKAQGNPFFLQEFVRLCSDRGLDPEDVAGLRQGGLPDSLHRLALARLDGLPEPEQATIRVASVIGRRFAEPWLSGSDASLGEPDRVRRQLEHLERVSLTEMVAADPVREHLFQHAIVQEAAYTAMSDGSRVLVHGQIGRYLERAFADDPSPVVDALAYHFERTDDLPRRRRWLRRAASSAFDSWANEVAVDYLERLLPVAAGSERPDLLRALGEARERAGDWHGAEEALSQADAAAVERGDRLTSVRARVALGYLVAHRGSAGDAVALLEEAVHEAGEAGDEASVRKGLEYLGFAAWQHGELEASADASRRLMADAERAGDAVALSMAHQNLAMVHQARGDFRAAERGYVIAIELAEGAGDVRGSIHALNDLAGLAVQRGALTEAFEHLKRALGEARRIGYRHLEGALVGNAGELYREHGELDLALRCTLDALAIMVPLRDWPDIVTRLGNLSLILQAQGEIADALRCSALAVELAGRIDDPYTSAIFRSYRAELLAQTGDPDAATAEAALAAKLGRRHGFHDVELRAGIVGARLRLGADITSVDEALAELDALAHADDTPTERAILAFEAWSVAPSDLARRTTADTALRAIYASMPNAGNRHRFEAVTGELPPPVDALPPLVWSADGGPDNQSLDVPEAIALGERLLTEFPVPV